ncbi:MAG TPA: ABC transporter permease [Thermomicrobiales bacterium]|nr:ABC transporter permease [Thermomicrobiales bacterium]
MAREAQGPPVSGKEGSTPTLAAHADAKLALDSSRVRPQRSLWNNAWRQFRHHRLAMAGLIVFLAFILITALGPFFYQRPVNSPFEYDTSMSPSLDHLLGTDSLGQDILARILYGGRISLAVGIVAALVAIGIGTFIGAMAGFFGGFADSVLMRLTDLFLALPQLPLLLLITFLFGQSMKNFGDRVFGSPTIGIFLLIVVVIGVLAWMQTARLVRASFLSVKEKEFVEAARSIGATRSSLIFKQILPNVLSPIIVAATLEVGAAIITESSLAFLGLGFPSDVPSWGRMLYEAKDYLQMSPHEALIPGTMIFLTVLAINYMGDGLRDALDPRKSS